MDNNHANIKPVFIKADNLLSPKNYSNINTEGIAAFGPNEDDKCFYVRLLGDQYCKYKVCKKDKPESYHKLQQIEIID
jgi:hypothetical protein